MLWKWSLLKVDHGVFFLCLGSSSKFNQDAAGGLPSDLVAQALEFTVDVSILSITRFYTARGNFNFSCQAHPELS